MRLLNTYIKCQVMGTARKGGAISSFFNCITHFLDLKVLSDFVGFSLLISHLLFVSCGSIFSSLSLKFVIISP